MASPDAIRRLVQPAQVHRSLYTDAALFELERRHFFGNTWLFAGHASQLPKPGDYLALQLAGRPIVLVRQGDGAVRGFYNRCAHKGTELVAPGCGNTGKFLRCPYHAWSYRLDGTLLGVPLKQGYEDTGFQLSGASQGLTPLKHLQVYRGFVFVKFNDAGPDFHAYFGDALGAIDNMVDRSPTGELVVEGGILRSLVRCNWKTYLENINDTVHPVSTHESAVRAAQHVWQDKPAEERKPMAIEQILPFGSSYEFFDGMGGRVFANGHSVLGTNFSIHSGYGLPPDYEASLVAAHGAERTREVLERSPQNAVLYPSLSVKGSPLAIRVIRPLAVDRTVVEAWSFRAVGGPELLRDRALTYNRLVFSPMSVVAHDDLHLFEAIQRGLLADGNEWVSLHRGWREGEQPQPGEPGRDVSGTNELLMRNQFRAWAHFMALGLEDAA